MKPSANFFNLVKSSEGFRSSPYMDNKHGRVYTIGYGTTKYPDGTPVTYKDKPITMSQALDYLANDVKNAIATIDKLVKVKLNQNQFDALLDFVYNIGETQFKNSTVLKKINANPLDPTIKDEFKRWVFDNGVKLNGLIVRRDITANLYFKAIV